MLLTISTTHEPADELGYLLAKNPARVQSFAISFGNLHVFYPEASAERCTVALLLDIDPVALVRGRSAGAEGLLDQYVKPTGPTVASSFLSVALAEVFGTALNGRSRERPELAATPIALEAQITALPVRGGPDMIERLFAPLGYNIRTEAVPLDPQFPEWGMSRYVKLTLRGVLRLSDLLTHLYVLIPVLDADKHYYFGLDEIDKLLRRGAGWLVNHPERDLIAARYLKRRQLVRAALARLEPEEASDEEEVERPTVYERRISLHEQRLGATLAALKRSGAQRVLDLGCGEGRLLELLLGELQFTTILGMDVAYRSLERAQERLARLPELQRQRVQLIQGSLTYRDDRLKGFDAAAVVEVIEHLDLARLHAFERALFGHARPRTVVLTTPNAAFNVRYETLDGGSLRHSDHRFEWTRAEFAAWAEAVAARNGYEVRLLPIGPEDPEVGAPSQMGIFVIP
ncbi:3' terminal RNA ribose 2'-O-methyltransferase Hen1 [Candidatus Gracilibacteria bacterium]|nr:3' terminal RNA ribose 2'-O-methyltransferase Hen1 [Candidatus Gracilibacteria bacterium]